MATNRAQFQPERHSNKLRVKTAFVSAILQRDAERIRADQNRVADEWNLFKETGSGKLKNMLQGHFSINSTSDGGSLTMHHLVYARFLDMSTGSTRIIRQTKREGYHLYNRILFGNIYNRTLPGLKYGFTEEVRDVVQDAIAGAVEINPQLRGLIIKKLRT